jgi:hypothetical protein
VSRLEEGPGFWRFLGVGRLCVDQEILGRERHYGPNSLGFSGRTAKPVHPTSHPEFVTVCGRGGRISTCYFLGT